MDKCLWSTDDSEGFHLESHQAEDHLCLVCTGRVDSLEDLVRYAEQVHLEALRQGRKDVLLDERALSVSLDVHDMLYFSEINAPNTPLGLYLKCASVCSPANLERMKSLELFLRNRAYEFRVFLDMDAAREWLHS